MTRLAPVPLVPELRVHTLTGRIEQHWERLGSLPYWGHPWPGGQALARHVLDHPELIRGRHVLDLAAGCGVAGLAAARAAAAEVIASDVDPLARTAIALNAAANDLRVTVIAADLLDADLPGPDLAGTDLAGTDLAGTDLPGTDLAGTDRFAGWVVLAGDACYEAELARRVTAFGRRAAAAGALVLLGDPGRTYVDTRALERLAEYDVPTREGVERDEVTRTTVWRLRG